MTDLTDELKARMEKLQKIKDADMVPYAERYERTHHCNQAVELDEGITGVKVAGRIMAIRKFGKLIFGHIQDSSGRIQFALQKNELGESFALFKSIADIGDFIGIEGDIITTRTGEKTVNTGSWTFLSKALRGLPEKWHSLTNLETRHRQRHLDMIMNPESKERFEKRAAVVSSLRRFLEDNAFIEVDTPVLQTKPSGALAKPFMTHHNAYDMDVYLRIAPETYLKRAVAGGLERVYEFARCFRNEGLDPSHLQDFTLLEYYAAYWNYEDNMDFTEKLIRNAVGTFTGGEEKITFRDNEINFSGKWPRISFTDLIKKDCGIDLNAHDTPESLLAEIRKNKIELEEDADRLGKLGKGPLADLLYKKVSRPGIVNPVFVTDHPIELSPLARKNDENGNLTDRFQLVVCGWEIVNAYSELVDPVDQRQRFEDQMTAREKGDDEAMVLDEDFLLCMEHGMPPISGWGLGVDRFVALLTGQENLRETILFPLMKPEG